MRALFLLLLLANLAFFAWAHYWVPQNPGSDARPLGRQIDPQKLPIVAPPAKAGPASSAAGPSQVSGACVEWGSFTPDNVAAAKKLLQPAGGNGVLGFQRISATSFIHRSRGTPAPPKRAPN